MPNVELSSKTNCDNKSSIGSPNPLNLTYNAPRDRLEYRGDKVGCVVATDLAPFTIDLDLDSSWTVTATKVGSGSGTATVSGWEITFTGIAAGSATKWDVSATKPGENPLDLTMKIEQN